jgi:hypothetical protein
MSYRYVECTKYEGKTLRTGGVTRRSLAALKHLPKIGMPRYVKGYVYMGHGGTTHIGVLVRGTKGSIRFGGFGWGYYGEGPRGLAELFRQLNIDADPSTLAHWPDFSPSSVGEYWRIECHWEVAPRQAA